MITNLPGLSLPTESTLDINIRVTQPLNITPFSARQKVTQYVMHELSTQLGGDAPELTVGERVYSSVPVVFTLPGKGVLGRVGTMRIDANRRAADRSAYRAGDDAQCRAAGSMCHTFNRSLSIHVSRLAPGWYWPTTALLEPKPSCADFSTRDPQVLVPAT